MPAQETMSKRHMFWEQYVLKNASIQWGVGTDGPSTLLAVISTIVTIQVMSHYGRSKCAKNTESLLYCYNHSTYPSEDNLPGTSCI